MGAFNTKLQSKNYEYSCHSERSGVKNLGGYKREILRWAQNDKK